MTLLERRGSLGGRTIAIPQPEINDVPDNGQHVFASGYENLFRYLDSVGTRQHVAFPGHMSIRMPGGAVRRSSFAGLDGLRTLLGDLPGVGAIFRSETTSRRKTDLVILLTPRVMTPARVAESAAKELERVR